MKFDIYTEKLTQLKAFITIGNTGTPHELANRLNISERTTRRMVEKLKEQKMPVRYCRKTKSYKLTNC
jgi:DNA-binding IclR family transcriptional regulator